MSLNRTIAIGDIHGCYLALDTILDAISPTMTDTIIILGDFNDEPFDAALADHLMATRDRALAAKKSHLLYNPFWRLLGCPIPYRQTSQEMSPYSGSCYYRSGESARWRTFDQIIFSPSFLGKTSWHLCEDLVQILDFPFFTDIVRRAKHSFDHLPVIAVVEKA